MLEIMKGILKIILFYVILGEIYILLYAIIKGPIWKMGWWFRLLVTALPFWPVSVREVICDEEIWKLPLFVWVLAHTVFIWLGIPFIQKINLTWLYIVVSFVVTVISEFFWWAISERLDVFSQQLMSESADKY